MELVYAHWSLAVMLFLIAIGSGARWFGATTRVLASVRATAWVEALVYLALMGGCASFLISLTHDMFKWGTLERLPFLLGSVLLTLPAAATVLNRIKPDGIERGDRIKALPCIVLAGHFIGTVIFSLSPLTAIE